MANTAPRRIQSAESTSEAKQNLYALEKTVGRRDDSGKWKLQKLKPRHIAMAAASWEGWSNKRIAEEFGISTHTVSRVLSDPLVEEYLQTLYLGAAQELRGLIPSVIEAVRELVQEEADPELKMKAIDRFEKLYKLFTPEGREAGKGGVNMSLSISQNNASEGDETARQSAVDKLAEKLEALSDKMDGKSTDIVEGDVQEAEWSEQDGEESSATSEES